MKTKDVGTITAYGYACDYGELDPREVSEREFGERLASYMTVAQEAAGSAEEAKTAKTAAETARNQAQSAQTAVESAVADAESARTAAQTAATDAQTAKTGAESAQTAAESAKNTAVNAVDGFAAGAQQALDSVNEAGGNWKSLAEKQAGNSEAWAVGQRGGDDVATTDATYHNNAKYYAEQAGSEKTYAQTARQGAETAAANASQSATAAATSASQAAESARTLTIDDTLTQEGQAAGAKAVGNKFSSVNVDIIGSYNGSYTNDTIDSVSSLATVYAECEENCEYVVEKTATNKFAVFFTSYPPLNGLEILSYRVVDHTASKITVKAPQGAKYICAYVYNTNTDSSIDTMANVIASTSIKKSSAVDAAARASIKNVSAITDMVTGNDIDVSYGLGGISLVGAEQPDKNRIMSIGFIDKKESKTNIVINDPNYQFSVRYYKDGVFSSSDTAWRTASLSDVFAQDAQCNQIRIVVRLANNANITSSIIDDAIKAISVKNESGAFYIPAEVKKAIYELFSVSAYASTEGVSANLAVLDEWVGD